jgi:hypothetical protein
MFIAVMGVRHLIERRMRFADLETGPSKADNDPS